MISCRGVAKKRRGQEPAAGTVKCSGTVAKTQQSLRQGNDVLRVLMGACRHDLAARCARALQSHLVPPNTEGAGKAGCALHPRSRVQDVHKNTHTSIQVQRRASGLPCAMALRLITRSPRRRILVVTVACGLTILRIPVGFCKTSADLASATDARTTRLRRTLKRRSSTRRPIAHGKPALQLPLRADAAASTASQPAFVTIATRPSCRVRRAEIRH
jgi:hypothetical protein